MDVINLRYCPMAPSIYSFLTAFFSEAVCYKIFNFMYKRNLEYDYNNTKFKDQFYDEDEVQLRFYFPIKEEEMS